MFKFNALFCILNCVPIHTATELVVVIFQSISLSKSHGSFCSMRRISFIQNQIVNRVNIFLNAALRGLPLLMSLDCAGVSELHQHPTNATSLFV